MTEDQKLFPQYRRFEKSVAGRSLIIETGKMAKQANGAVLVGYGDTVVLVTATASETPREGVDFLPLVVDYEERLYAVGRIPGSWTRREGRPHDKAILAARLVDRPIRPLFPEGFRNEVQVVVTVLSADLESPPDVCGIIGASAALSISDIPFFGPVGAVEVGVVDGEVVAFPDRSQSARSAMRLVVAGTKDAVLMVEAGANQVPEDVVLRAIEVGHGVVKEIVEFIEEIVGQVGREKRPEFFPPGPKADVLAAVEERIGELAADQAVEQEILASFPGREREVLAAISRVLEERIAKAVDEECLSMLKDALERSRSIPSTGVSVKKAREAILDDAQAVAAEKLLASFPGREAEVRKAILKALKREVRKAIFELGIRPDGRKPEEIRPIVCEVGLLPRTHGSALFTRGETQVLTVATLGAIGDVQFLDDVGEEESKRYMHHYNFPPYSTGETRPIRGPGRREIGHGALAERALEPVIPSEDEFPYTVRLVSEVLESNGSTSMASVCGSTLSLMDAGVPIKAPVAGVAMGLVKDESGFVVLTDIQGMEDALGDMDFKVAGTEAGITALQMDIKVRGIGIDVIGRALEQARKGRLYILEKMLEAIPGPRKELSPYAPRILVMEIEVDKIRDVIGPGGRVINKIIAETNTKIDIEQDGKIYISGENQESSEKAMRMIQALTKDVTAGEIYVGKVTRITNFGAFVEIGPGKEGLVHVSELAEGRVNRVEDVVRVGDEVLVKVIEIDRFGRINLSRKQALRSQAPLAGGAGRDQRRGSSPTAGNRDKGKFLPPGFRKELGRSAFRDERPRPAGKR